MKRDIGELSMAALVLGVGGLAIYGASRHAYYTEFGPDAGFFPFWVGLGQSLIGLALVARYLRTGVTRTDAPMYGSRRRQLTVAALFLGYVLLLHAVGFVPATGIFLFAVMLGVESRSIRETGLIVLGLTFGLFALFGWAFRIPLPQGIFGDF